MFLLTLLLIPRLSPACGLDWSLPQAHFEGVDEQCHVAYWEKIGQVNLGDGEMLPVHIGFNSRREASSPTLGKGWILPLLESHVEPVDENTMNVIMPDGWTFLFLRNGNTETWRGNAGWVGETDGPRFTITAPCGWRVKFDTGKIQEIDTPKNRTITIKYNGRDATEADIDSQPFVQVEDNTATGVAQDILIGGQKIDIAQAQRPRIQTVLGQTLITGFDPSLSQLQWPDGKKETFDFAAPQNLIPTLGITHSDQTQRNFTWDPATTQIKTDGDWAYHFPSANGALERTNANGQTESWFYDGYRGEQITLDANGIKTVKSWFTTGRLARKPRSKITSNSKGVVTSSTRWAYDENGRLIRMIKDNTELIVENGYLTEYQNNNKVWSLYITNRESK